MRIDTIYYVNLAHNVERNLSMQWLLKAPVPVRRIEGIRLSNATCVSKFSERWCRGAAGLATAHSRLLSTLSHDKYVAVFEDDYRPTNDAWWNHMNAAIKAVPRPWDVIRFDCWGYVPHTFKRLNSRTFQTHHRSECNITRSNKRCWFCGGTHALVYNTSARHRIQEHVSRLPFDDIDCRMSEGSWGEHNYCYNAKLFARSPQFASDIPKK